jgi:hypothetical protein
VVSGKEELLRLREKQDAEVRGRREEVEREERRLQEREAQLDRKSETIDQRDRELARRASELGRREKVVTDQQAEIDTLKADATRRLEELAGCRRPTRVPSSCVAWRSRRTPTPRTGSARSVRRHVGTPSARRRRSWRSPCSASRPSTPRRRPCRRSRSRTTR